MKLRNAAVLVALAVAAGAGAAWLTGRASSIGLPGVTSVPLQALQPTRQCGPAVTDAAHPGMVWVPGR
jgi:hypothetical protein